MTIDDNKEAPPRAPSAVIAAFLRNSISLSDVIRQIWAGRWIILACFLLGLMWGGYNVRRAGPLFIGSISIVPAQSDIEGGSPGGAMGMLAGLAGGGSGAAVPKFTQFLASIHTVGVAEAMDRKYGTLCTIFSSDCDQKTKKWHERKGRDAFIDGFLARLGGLPNPNGPRTAVELSQVLGQGIVVTTDKISGITQLSYFNRDPKFCAELLSQVFRTANDYIKDQDREVQRQYVDYLANRLATNTNVAQRDALSNLLLQQERKLMMTAVDVPYAATILDGPVVLPVNQVAKTLLINSIIGGMLGVLIALGRYYGLRRWQMRRRP